MELFFFFLLLLPLLLLPLLLLKKLTSQNGDGNNLPPGPRSFPIIGNLHQIGSVTHRSLADLSQKHGPLMFLRLGSIPTLVVSSGDTLKAIFKSHDVVFSGRPVFQAAKKLSFNNSNVSFAPYGENWRQARKLCVLELLSSRRVTMLVAAIKKLSSSFPSSAINLSEMVFALSYNVMCRAVFGDRHAGGAAVYQGQRSWFHEWMAETQGLVTGFCVADFFPRWGWIDGIIGHSARLEKNFEVLKGFYEGVIEEHLNRDKVEKEEEDDGVPRGYDLVDALLKFHREAINGDFLSSMDSVKGIMGDIFFAGTDTSSATVIWTMTELIRNPRVMAKLQHQLEDVICSKSSVEETDLEQLDYLKLVIKEALRLHPPVPLLVPRETRESCKIEGYDIPSKTRVLINASAIARDPNVWKDPNEFFPERFADSKAQDYNYVPFGVGRRSCPGVNFADAVMELVLANILHCFEWHLPDGMKPEDVDMEGALGLVIHEKEPLRLLAKPKK